MEQDEILIALCLVGLTCMISYSSLVMVNFLHHGWASFVHFVDHGLSMTIKFSTVFQYFNAIVEHIHRSRFLLPLHDLSLGLLHTELEHVFLQSDLIILELLSLCLFLSPKLELFLHIVNFSELVGCIAGLRRDLTLRLLPTVFFVCVDHVPEVVATIWVHLVSGLLFDLAVMISYCLFKKLLIVLCRAQHSLVLSRAISCRFECLMIISSTTYSDVVQRWNILLVLVV